MNNNSCKGDAPINIKTPDFSVLGDKYYNKFTAAKKKGRNANIQDLDKAVVFYSMDNNKPGASLCGFEYLKIGKKEEAIDAFKLAGQNLEYVAREALVEGDLDLALDVWQEAGKDLNELAFDFINKGQAYLAEKTFERMGEKLNPDEFKDLSSAVNLLKYPNALDDLLIRNNFTPVDFNEDGITDHYICNIFNKIIRCPFKEIEGFNQIDLNEEFEKLSLAAILFNKYFPGINTDNYIFN